MMSFQPPLFLNQWSGKIFASETPKADEFEDEILEIPSNDLE